MSNLSQMELEFSYGDSFTVVFKLKIHSKVGDKVGDKVGEKVGEKLSVNRLKIIGNMKENSNISAKELSALAVWRVFYPL